MSGKHVLQPGRTQILSSGTTAFLCSTVFAVGVEVFHLVERYGLSLDEVSVQVVNTQRSSVRVVRDAAHLVRDLFRIRTWAATGVYEVGTVVEVDSIL